MTNDLPDVRERDGGPRPAPPAGGPRFSVSLIFVLETMVQQAESAKAISTGVAFAFGPGVTVEGMLFDIIRR